MDTRLDQRRQFLQRQFAAEFRGLKIKAASTVREVTSYYDNIGERCYPASYDRYYDRGERHRSLGRAAMERLGFRKLGSGHFADVFEHDLVPGYVVKVSWVDGDMGRMWAKWCEDNTHLPYLPKIIEPTMHGGNVWSCWMPKYDTIDYYGELPPALSKVAKEQFSVASSVFSEVAGWGGIYGLGAPRDEYPELVEVCRQVIREFEGYGEFDLHRGNAMWDPERVCIVLTDPLSFPYGEED